MSNRYKVYPKRGPKKTVKAKRKDNKITKTHYTGNNPSSEGSSGWTRSGGSNWTHVHEYPKAVFSIDGLEIWGSAKDKLNEAGLNEQDLIINCTGITFTSTPFVKAIPEWMKLNYSTKTPDQILLDWSDFSPPPRSIGIGFWQSIIAQAKTEKKKRVICCCTAGHGRTGTALAALLYSSAPANYDNSMEVVRFIKKVYCPEAIETDGQKNYIAGMVLKDHPLAKQDTPYLEDEDADETGRIVIEL